MENFNDTEHRQKVLAARRHLVEELDPLADDLMFEAMKIEDGHAQPEVAIVDGHPLMDPPDDPYILRMGAGIVIAAFMDLMDCLDDDDKFWRTSKRYFNIAGTVLGGRIGPLNRIVDALPNLDRQGLQ